MDSGESVRTLRAARENIATTIGMIDAEARRRREAGEARSEIDAVARHRLGELECQIIVALRLAEHIVQ